jgi:hypothetical protein
MSLKSVSTGTLDTAPPVAEGSRDTWLAAQFPAVVQPDGHLPEKDANSAPRMHNLIASGKRRILRRRSVMEDPFLDPRPKPQ